MPIPTSLHFVNTHVLDHLDFIQEIVSCRELSISLSLLLQFLLSLEHIFIV